MTRWWQLCGLDRVCGAFFQKNEKNSVLLKKIAKVESVDSTKPPKPTTMWLTAFLVLWPCALAAESSLWPMPTSVMTTGPCLPLAPAFSFDYRGQSATLTAALAPLILVILPVTVISNNIRYCIVLIVWFYSIFLCVFVFVLFGLVGPVWKLDASHWSWHGAAMHIHFHGNAQLYSCILLHFSETYENIYFYLN